MTGFLGSYLHQLDEKGRLALPVSFRRAVGDDGFVLIHGFEPALFLYPARSWKTVEAELAELLRKQGSSRKSVRRLAANAVVATPDKQGRILIPERLQEAAQLDSEALIVGVLDKIEIWNPQLFETATRESTPEVEQFVRQILV